MTQKMMRYSVRSDGEIIAISGAWDEFASMNGAPALTRLQVLGENLFQFIQGETVRHIYHSLHYCLFHHQERTIRFDYRCDGSGVRRWMSMTLRHEDDCILYESVILREEQLEHALPPMRGGGVDLLITMCSWCKDYQDWKGSGQWKPLETIFEDLPASGVFTHGICPSCMETMETLTA